MEGPPKVSVVDWTLFIAALSLAVSALSLLVSGMTLVLSELRRGERVTFKVNSRYRVDLSRDLVQFPHATKFVSAKTGERATVVTVTYHGPHELHIRNLYASLTMFGLQRLPGSLPCDIRLRDGQNAIFFVLFREYRMEDIEAFILETTTHGNIIKPVNRLRTWWRWRKFDSEVNAVPDTKPEEPTPPSLEA